MATSKQIILAALKQKFPQTTASITQVFQGVQNMKTDLRLYREYDSLTMGGTNDFLTGNNKPTDSNYKSHLHFIHVSTVRQEVVSDLKRCFSFFCVFMIPGIGLWLSLPLAVYAPNIFLSRQFWSEEQRCKIYNTKLLKRQHLFPGAIQYLQEELDRIKDPGVKRQCHNLLTKSDRGLNNQELRLFRRAIGQFPRLKETLNPYSPGPDKRILKTTCVPYLTLMHTKTHIQQLRFTDLILGSVAELKPEYLQELDRSILDLICFQRAIRTDPDKTEQLNKLEKFLDEKPSEYFRYTIFDLYVPILMFGHKHWFQNSNGS